MSPATTTMKDYKVEHANDWCPGCGDFGILTSVQQALARLEVPSHEAMIFGGIGCSGKAPYYIKGYSVHTLHGRPVPFATGAKLAHPELEVIVLGGDGDGLGIGAGHFVNAGRRNVDLTYVLFNNEVYGLTKGQASPTLPLGLQPKSLPEPNMQGQVNGLMLAMSSGFTWIGRGYAFDVRSLVDLIVRAVEHPGLSYLEVLQPCPTYNDLHDKDYWGGTNEAGDPRLRDLEEDEGYDPVIREDMDDAAIQETLAGFMARANQAGERIPTGVFLVNRNVPTYAERLEQRVADYRENAPAVRPIADDEGQPVADLSEVFAEVAVGGS